MFAFVADARYLHSANKKAAGQRVAWTTAVAQKKPASLSACRHSILPRGKMDGRSAERCLRVSSCCGLVAG